jgi:hypothetical protein
MTITRNCLLTVVVDNSSEVVVGSGVGEVVVVVCSVISFQSKNRLSRRAMVYRRGGGGCLNEA